jgi:hypothetical protein
MPYRMNTLHFKTRLDLYTAYELYLICFILDLAPGLNNAALKEQQADAGSRSQIRL